MRIAGNLDVEVTWARMDAAARRARGEKAPSSDDPRFALPEPVMRKISAAATLLRVFAESDDDVLWTPRPVDPSRMARVEWLPTPRLESGPVPETADVWWGEPTEVAAQVNHRLFAWSTRLRPGLGQLRGTTLIRSMEQLDRAIDDLRRGFAEVGWVAKAPLSAAGRLRVRGESGEMTDAARAQAERLLGLYGLLVFEPWVPRIADFGVCGGAIHRLQVDGGGRFVGISVGDAGLGHLPRARVLEAASTVEAALLDAGYRGPFGIDGFQYRAEGAWLHPVSEINARRTFGHVARAAVNRCRPRLNLSDDAPVALRFGRGAPPSDAIPLLLPDDDDDTCAWLEPSLRHGA